MWLYFRLTDVEPGRFEFVITNLLARIMQEP